MGIVLVDADEGLHEPGSEVTWNESRYIDFWDADTRTGGWFRIGARPNADYAEMSACVYLPDGSAAFAFERATIAGNGLTAGGLTWGVPDPWRLNTVQFTGQMSLLADPWLLTRPKEAFTTSPLVDAEIDLRCVSAGPDAVLGQDQDQHHMIFLPGQADFHYQHMTRVTGTIRLDGRSIEVDGRGGKDHSWGPRNWHAKIYLRWLTACIDDANGFMLTRAVGPTKQTRSGFVLSDGRFQMVDDVTIRNTYAGAPHHELRRTEVTVRADDVAWSAVGTPLNWLPARHRQVNEAGEEALLRIVKQPAVWTFADGRSAVGHLEYHDLVEDGVPVGLHD